MKMKKKDAVVVIKSLRCMGCKRAPTPEEMAEMYASFGYKLVCGDEPRLRWRCRVCMEKAK